MNRNKATSAAIEMLKVFLAALLIAPAGGIRSLYIALFALLVSGILLLYSVFGEDK